MTADAAPSRREEAQIVRLLMEQVFSLTGYDYRDYALSYLRTRLSQLSGAEGGMSLSALRQRALADPGTLERLVAALAARPGGFYRQPELDQKLRELVYPLLRTYPSARLWLAGCGQGEEAYALAAALKEEGLWARCRPYATDLGAEGIRLAKSGIYPLGALQGAAQAYRRAGGNGNFSDHYSVRGALAAFDAGLRERIVFSEHSLASDASFNEFHVVLCRDLLSSFNRALRERAHRLFYSSLCPFGILALNRADSIAESPFAMGYALLNPAAALYRKVR